MTSSFKVALAAVLLLGLCGCAARPVTETAISQAGDEMLSCDAIQQQITDNNVAYKKLVKSDKDVEAGNTAKIIATATPFVGFMFAATVDMSNEEQVKARALADRNERLIYLAKQKGCIS